MSSHRMSSGSRTARIVVGAIALVLLLALLATVFLSRGTVDEAESQAEARAVDWANTTLFDAVTPEEVAAPILGPDYRELLIIVQAGILSDDRAVRVRLWNADGVLVFSTDQRDKIDEFIAVDNPQIEAALGGETVSLPTQTTVAPRSGLAGADEELFQTFVPLRLENQLGTSGVAQIDQRYAAIEAEASDTWQTVRLVLVLALTVAVGAFLFTLRRRPAEEWVAVGAEAAAPLTRQDRKALERATKAEDELRIAVERAEQAEAALAETDGTMNEAAAQLRELQERAARSEERAANAEAALREAAIAASGGEAPRRGVPGVGAVAVGAASVELASKLEAAESEREQLTGEVGRLRAALAEREAELALAREGEGAPPDDDEIEGVRRLAVEHEQRAADLEARLADAARDLSEGQARIAELEGLLREAETAAVAASAATVVTKGKATSDLEALHARTTKELEAARAELAKADAELAVTREALVAKEAETTVARDAEAGAAAVAAELATVQALVKELETRAAAAEERATNAEAAATQAETTRAEGETRATEAETRAMEAETRATEAEERATAAETRIAEAEAARKEAETARAKAATELQRARAEAATELERARAEAAETPVAGESVEELSARVAELEAARRTDVVELQRAQETLVNTQLEATQARRRVKELEQQLHDVEAAPAPAVPQYVPEPETSFSARLASLVREHEAPTEPAPAPAPQAEPPAEEEGLSLRERLARAAAARHRAPGAPGPDA